MTIFKLAAAAALVASSLSASAMTAIADQDLSAVAGQDGVSIAADLNINIGAFTYGDTDGAGTHTVSFNNITVKGLMAMTIDVIGAQEFIGDLSTALTNYGSANTGNATLGALGLALGYNNTADVVQFAFPSAGAQAADAHLSTPTISVGSIKTGNGGSSFGSITITNLDLQGTKVWMFGHN